MQTFSDIIGGLPGSGRLWGINWGRFVGKAACRRDMGWGASPSTVTRDLAVRTGMVKMEHVYSPSSASATLLMLMLSSWGVDLTSWIRLSRRAEKSERRVRGLPVPCTFIFYCCANVIGGKGGMVGAGDKTKIKENKKQKPQPKQTNKKPSWISTESFRDFHEPLNMVA